MTERVFQVPQYVLDNQVARHRARQARLNRTCCYDTCNQPAARARGGRAARCLQHDLEEFGEPIIPDPTRTLAALRAKAGLRPDAVTIGRTVLDTRAETKGQRVSSARRAQARGDAG